MVYDTVRKRSEHKAWYPQSPAYGDIALLHFSCITYYFDPINSLVNVHDDWRTLRRFSFFPCCGVAELQVSAVAVIGRHCKLMQPACS
jgi:hypothetical protein